MASRRRSSRRRSVRSRAPARRRTTARRAAPRRRAPTRRPATTCSSATELSLGARFALAQLDPFHISVTGAKIPDSTVIPSLSITDVEIANQSSTAVAGELHAIAFRPAYVTGRVSAGSGVGTVAWPATFAGSNRSKAVAYGAAIELNRPVAHAIRMSSPVAPTSATGFVHIALSTESHYGVTTWQWPTTIAQLSGCQYYKRVTLASLTQSPLTFINKYIDDTAFRYRDPLSIVGQATSVDFQADLSWGALIVMVEGAPISQIVLSFEHLLITEGLPQKDGPIIGSIAAAASPGTISSVSQMSATTEPFHTEADQNSYVQEGISALAEGAREQGAAVFNNVAVPLLERAGRAAVNGATAQFMAMTGMGGIAGVNSNPHRLEA